VATSKTQAEQTYEAIKRLMDGGMSMADAVRKLAKQQGKKENAVRGNYYNHARKLAGGGKRQSRRSTRTALSADDAVARAKQVLKEALGAVDQEVQEAKREFQAAKKRYDDVVASADSSKRELHKKIAAL
jgi:uncharacterized protein YoaH (UPF0181 family)